jgi:hypothetical protein
MKKSPPVKMSVAPELRMMSPYDAGVIGGRSVSHSLSAAIA